MQEDRIQQQRRRGDGLEACTGRKIEISVDRVLTGRGKMLNAWCHKMLQELPMESVYEITLWFQKRFRGECWAPRAWKILRLVFLKKLDAKLENGIRGFRAFALMSVLAKWYAAGVVGLLHEEPEPIGWRSCMLVPRGVSTVSICTVLLANILQRHSEWQEDRRDARVLGFFKYWNAFVAGLDVRTALHVAKCSVMCKILPCMVTNGHVVAALLGEMKDARSSACFENSETEFRYSRCIRQRSVEAPV